MSDMKDEVINDTDLKKQFGKAVIDYKEKIYLMLLKYVRNRDDALDLTQEAFIKAYNSLSEFKAKSKIETWIYRIAINLALNFKSRNKYAKLNSIDDSLYIYESNSPSSDILNKELSEKIDQAVTQLPNRQKMSFVLRYYEDLPFAKIADYLGVTEGAAKANYHQAIKKIKDNLGSYIRGIEK